MSRIRRKKINPPLAFRPPFKLSDVARFMGKVSQGTRQYRGTACWEWAGHRDENGYGQLWMDGQARWAYRVAYAMFRGAVPAGREIDHKCHNTKCVNPWHLMKKTPLANATEGGRRAHEECPI